ncbi:hypothetical protein A2875_02465 [Candidatus Gottesmanbacteria bacterium RIFCSPHIGHO2_01_FULL_46_14]|uniref:Glycosyltransferase RgtA/B/C/D-like domain-containing protein n=2 Tax=Microgenomates group TaxID=1794810 RepID=A0A1F5ZN30_9BACT|nr:MAG: hypothetical protein UU34_C0020G0002 [Candidatus Curtissbacteria bacterium GW2011_GWA1_41_11]OGG13763.1 MAG: hypothetical protein A2875_02465 [Candidatus Gottesmanbacteria bacterium RIFCSPHIGHO2_01_FULL_46_14]
MVKWTLIALLVLGFFLRGQELLSGNFLFLKDQGRDMLAVKSIVVDKKLTLIGPYTGLQAVFQGPLYYYLLAIPFAIFRGDPWGVMLLLMITSLASISMGFSIGGILTAFLFATSPALGAAATFFWSPFFVIPIMCGYVYFFMRWVKKGDKHSFVWLSITLALLYHFELAFAVPWTIVSILLFFHAGVRWYPRILFFLILFSIFPLILFDVRHDFLTTRSIFALVGGSAQGLTSSFEPYDKIIRDHIVSFVSSINASFFINASIAGLTSVTLIVGGIWYLAFGKRVEIKLLFVMPVLLWFVYLLYPFQLYSWYLVGLFPVYMILLGYGLSKHKNIAVGCMILISIFTVQKLLKLYTATDWGGTAKIRGKLAAIDTIIKDSQGKLFNVLVFTPVVLTDAYDYLFWWKYGSIPSKEKQDLTYLLIEPDPSKPWSHEGWLETVVSGGGIIETRTLPSGFIIQKRLYD